jgi:hypothetical protein
VFPEPLLTYNIYTIHLGECPFLKIQHLLDSKKALWYKQHGLARPDCPTLSTLSAAIVARVFSSEPRSMA